MLGTYVMYLEIGREDAIMMTDNLATKITISNLQIPVCRHHEVRKVSQKYGQSTCHKSSFLVKRNLPVY